jgi:hypothetical protein
VACRQEMNGTSCTAGHDTWEASWSCPDCACLPGGMHHLGCDLELCPCGEEQAIGCLEHFAARWEAAASRPELRLIDGGA